MAQLIRALAVILVFLGVLVALYPFGEDLYRDYRVQLSLEAFELEQGFENQGSPVKEPYLRAEEKEAAPLALLEIPKIDLKLPVFVGSSRDDLRYGAVLLEDWVGIGEEGNAVITAHRAHSYGHLFNRLDELEAGDKIAVITPQERYRYSVYETYITEAGDTSYLKSSGVKELTLVTCHPLYWPNPPYRLVVKAQASKS